MKLVVLSALFCLIAAVSCEIDMQVDASGKYNFKYNTEDAGAHKREESGTGDGSVTGSFSYIDANGDLRKTDYKAGPGIGFQPSGDITVDKKTAEKAAELAALAPKAPVTESAEVKIPASPFTLPLYAMPGIHHTVPLAAPLTYAFPHHLALPLPYGA
ncbi:Adult-specific rigid cuticular protein 12.6, partial [Stegodyphus mimosarum]